MKKMKKLAALSMAAAMAVSLAACGGESAGASSEASGETAAESTATASGEVIEVDFWTAPQQVQYDLWESWAVEFNATNTQVNGKTVQVKVQQMPESPSSEAGIQNAIATGTAPPCRRTSTAALPLRWRLPASCTTCRKRTGSMRSSRRARWATR